MMKSVLGSVVDPIMKVLSEYIVDKDHRETLRTQITGALIDQETSIIQASRDVVLAEAQGSWMQRNWRPSLMFCFIGILGNNYILYPYAMLFGLQAAVLEFPSEFWGLMTVGVGGYVAGRTIEKVGPSITVGQVAQGNKQDG